MAVVLGIVALFFVLLVLSPFISAMLFLTLSPVTAIRDLVRVRRLHRDNQMAHHDFFFRNFHYYNLLNAEEQQTFIRRVNLILSKKEFQGESQVQVGEDVKLLFAGTLVKLTFGLHNYELAWHGTIIFFPSLFVFGKNGQSMKGLTFFSDRMVFSLPDFLHGIKDPHDKLDLALHECAHALKANHVRDITHLFENETRVSVFYDTANRFEERFILWYNEALPEYRAMQQNKSGDHFFRQYAAANMDEFWAVSIEHFFEAPIEFRQRHPKLYEHTALLLNQDIAQRFTMRVQEVPY
jgi:hypothetical protein